ncbi:sorting nexin-19-like, partial [Lampetra fluviatilis]
RLCGIGEVAESEEVREFLALNTDARIAFVRKTPTLVPRIDKMVVNLVDSLKTAFPKSEGPSPSEEDGDCGATRKDAGDGKLNLKSKLFPARSKAAAVLSGDAAELPEKFSYVFDQDQALQEGLSIEDVLRQFVAGQSELIAGAAGDDDDPPPPPPPPPPQPPIDAGTGTGTVTAAVTTTETEAAAAAQGDDAERPRAELAEASLPESECAEGACPLAELALDLLAVAFGGAAPWLQADSLHRFLHHVAGSLVQRSETRT